MVAFLFPLPPINYPELYFGRISFITNRFFFKNPPPFSEEICPLLKNAQGCFPQWLRLSLPSKPNAPLRLRSPHSCN